MRWSAKTREEILQEIKKLSKELEVHDDNQENLEQDSKQAEPIQTLDHLNLVSMTVERNGIISYCNDFTTKATGWQKHELLGQDFFELLIPKDERIARKTAFLLALDKGGIFASTERTILSKNGSLLYLSLNSVINNTENDKIQAITLVGEDVTEKRKTDIVLARRNEQLGDLVANTSDLIQILSLRGKILFVNATWKDVLGYSDEDLLNLNIRDLIHPEFLEKTLETLRRIENGEKIPQIETVFRRKNGRRIYISGSINCRIENGKPVAFRCILHDATDKVRAERAQHLYYSIANSASASRNLNDLYHNIHEELGKVIDVKNFFIALYDSSYLHFPYYVDEAFEHQVRFTKRKLGNGLTEYAIMANKPLFLTDVDIQKLADDRNIYLYGQVPKCMLCAPLRIGDRLTGIIGVKSYERTNKYDIRDLTLLEFISGQVALAIERKQSEESLNKERARLQAIFESSSHLMWSVNKRLLLTSFNQNYHDFIKNLLNISPQINFSPEKLAWRMVNTENKKVLEDRYKLALKGESQHFELQFDHPNTQNDDLWYEIYLNPILLNNGMIEEVSGIARDISNLKKSSQETIHAKEEAERSLKVKERFLANMSHEIRTPMNGVIGMVDMLSDTPLDKEQNKYVQTIKKSSETLLNILNDILDLSKIEAGKMALHDAPLSIQEMLEKIIALFGQTAFNKGNELSYKLISNDLPAYIIADETRLLQMISNLTSNAIKFTENGKIEIFASKISSKGRIHKIKIEVKDSGVGISQQNLELLFNAFVQVDSSFTKSAGGTGLGLAITKSIAQLMKGETGVSSEEGKGSSFWVTFEAKETSIAPSQQKAGQGDFHVNDFLISYAPSILLVDDNAINRTVASEILRKAGCYIDTADGGKKALEMIKSNIEFSDNRYDLILMDIQMPEMDGIETTQRLRAAHRLNLPPVLAMTAYSMKEDRDRFLNAGLDDYIAKPIRAESLCKKVKEWLDRNKTTDVQAQKERQAKVMANIEEALHPMFDKEIVGQLIEMAGKEMVVSVYEDFDNEATDQIKESLAAWKTKDLKTIKDHLHTLKGNAGTIGLAKLHEKIKLLELKVKVDDFSSFDREMPLIEQEFEQFQSKYKGFLAEM